MGLGLENQGSSPNKGDILGVELLDICSQEYLCVCVSLSKWQIYPQIMAILKGIMTMFTNGWNGVPYFQRNRKKLTCCYGGSSPNSGGKAWSLKMFERSFFDLSQ